MTTTVGSVRGSIRVQRTKSRRKREWVTGTPKSKTSKRTVPLPPWLATRLAAYLEETHPHTDNPTAQLWPRRLAGNGSRKPVLDWSAPLDLSGFQSKLIIPALEAVGLPASRPQRTAEDGTVLPATKGVHLNLILLAGHARQLTVRADGRIVS